jgi:[NiFe] hydrogenase assembly HybE family chaperone
MLQRLSEMSTEQIYQDNPAPLLLAMYRRLAQAPMQVSGVKNPVLSVDIAGFRRYRGDWLGAVVTPWFVRLFLLPGGGELWREVTQKQGSNAPADERLRVEFPAGDLEFLAEYNPSAEVPAFFWCPVFASVERIGSQDEALTLAMEAFNSLFNPPPSAELLDSPDVAESSKAPVDRRGFLRRLVGRG